MAVFDSDKKLYTVLESVFDQLSARTDKAEEFAKSNVVIRMNFTDPAAQVTIDGRPALPEIHYGPTNGKVNMEFTMSADLLHRIWMGEESSSQAFFTGKIKSKGSFMKAMKLLDLFRECERVYPTVAAEFELL